MEYEESNLSRSFPTKFIMGPFKILEYKWYSGRYLVGSVLVWDLLEKRFKGFIGQAKAENIEEDVLEIAEYGAKLSTDETIIMFRKYFELEEIFINLDKNFKTFLRILEMLDEK